MYFKELAVKIKTAGWQILFILSKCLNYSVYKGVESTAQYSLLNTHEYF